ncbi:hypothetical protein B0F90DRAFT_1740314 [Multifurca ochricompacta]|uniref:Pyruvate carboxyltransferase domain-containing protein n=1 Tax=Multifurca ochricompacta TaxID=376703 RepID=A0AAD4QLR4_9AGAM|nr:hypothetical protein B0F90DRAFT_1740314 [Multifurca ochricompacta]
MSGRSEGTQWTQRTQRAELHSKKNDSKFLFIYFKNLFLSLDFKTLLQLSSSSTFPAPEMCPHQNGDAPPNGVQDMVVIVETATNGLKGANGSNGTAHRNGTNGHISTTQRRNPGEQFANAFFDTETKIAIAKALDKFGVEYIELTSQHFRAISTRLRGHLQLGLNAKILTHIRCHMDDARIAIETGVDGVDVVIGTSSFLREFSHGKDMTYITKTAIEVINFVKSKGIEVRFSTEIPSAPISFELVRTLRGVVGCDIEIHLHNDTGMAIANAYTALEAGATHIDTSVLGIGERVGITPLGGLVACLYAADPDYVKSKYNLGMLREIENLVAEAVEVNVPFSNPITLSGYVAFTHKAGIHAKAILNNPSTYEILKPEDFGLTRYVSIGHRLTGWNAVKSRVEQLGLQLTDDEIKDATAKIKELADVRTQSMDDVDSLLRVYHSGIQSGALEVGQKEALDRLLQEHRAAQLASA